MEKQVSFTDIEFNANKKKKTSKELFFEKIESIAPIAEWCGLIKEHYYANKTGRPAIPLENMFRVYIVSHCFNLSDMATEDACVECISVSKFVGGVHPDATTVCKFRKLLETNNLNEKFFTAFNRRLEQEKLMLRTGTIIDATIIDAPDSNKNKEKRPNPNMSSTYKRGKHFFGCKAHVAVDSTNGFVRSVVATTAKVADIAVASELLTGEETSVWGDAGYTGIAKREEICEKFSDGSGVLERVKVHGRNVDRQRKRDGIEFIINAKKRHELTPEQKEEEKEKSRVRIKVEHVFQKLKHIFGYRKTRYQTVEKTYNKLVFLFAMANTFRYVQVQERLKKAAK
jgi:IS5 family transposase